jgi:hypothetical protein
MGLSICYELSLPAARPEAEVHALLTRLRDEALALPFSATSELVRLTEHELEGPWPMRGLAFPRLEDVVDVTGRFVRDELYRERVGIVDEVARVDAPAGLETVLIGFAVAPGKGSEPAAFGLAKIGAEGESSRWSWHCCCKTQYVSAHGDDHFVRCHTSVVKLLDAAKRLGLDCIVHDEAGYHETRDESQLLQSVGEMNRLVARFAGQFTDAYTAAGGASREVQGEIFRHPDFERLETEGQ